MYGASHDARGADNAATESSDNNATQTETVDLVADCAIADDAGREVTISGVGALEKIYYRRVWSDFLLHPGS